MRVHYSEYLGAVGALSLVVNGNKIITITILWSDLQLLDRKSS